MKALPLYFRPACPLAGRNVYDLVTYLWKILLSSVSTHLANALQVKISKLFLLIRGAPEL